MPRRPTNRPRKLPSKPSEVIVSPGLPAGQLSPLAYLLGIVNDEGADPARRDKAAIAAAPYCHPKVADKGVKAQQAEAAAGAGVDSEWGDDLAPWPQ